MSIVRTPGRLARPGIVLALCAAATIGRGQVAPAHGLAEPGVCSACQPPLLPHTGSVMMPNVTVTPIYWDPAGYNYGDTADATTAFETLINRYINDLSQSATGDANTVAVTGEYTNAGGTPMGYGIAAGQPIVDTNPYPNGCTPQPMYSSCVSETQLRAEIATVAQNNNLTADLQHIDVVFMPKNAEIEYDTTHLQCHAWAGFHNSFGANGGTIVYALEPYIDGQYCGFIGQSPNNNPPADSVVSTLSHEISESLTDPNPLNGYADPTNNEIGDECFGNYGPSLGGTDGSMYNQSINGDNYFAQTEFSNAAYKANGVGNGCLQQPFAGTTLAVREHLAQGAESGSMSMETMITLNASPEKVPAGGTSTITLGAMNANLEPIAGDHIYFHVQPDPDMPGACGTLAGTDNTAHAYYASGIKDVTDANGEAGVTYHAPSGSAVCYVLATDTDAGETDGVMMYQGQDMPMGPMVAQHLPLQVHPGATASFAAQAMNPTSSTISDARFDVFLDGDNNGPLGLDASQVTVYYRDTATGGRFIRAQVEGTTADDGEIMVSVMPDAAEALPAHSTRTITFEIVLSPGSPTTASTGRPLRIETDLDNFNPAVGQQTNLDSAGPTNVTVR